MYLAIYITTVNGLFLVGRHTNSGDAQAVANEYADEHGRYPERILLIEVNDGIPVAAADWSLGDEYKSE
jgi:hypothetical protein